MSKFEPKQWVQQIIDRNGDGIGLITMERTDGETGAVEYWVEFSYAEGWFYESELQAYSLGIQHYIGPKGFAATNSTFVCGANAVGRRSTRLDTDPTVTTCATCKQDSWWQQAYADTTEQQEGNQ